jgi:hypothetical protein
MSAAGYAPSLAAVDPAGDPGVLDAFTRGVDVASTVSSAIVLCVLAILVGWSWRGRFGRRVQA